jgi:hypothetical protein
MFGYEILINIGLIFGIDSESSTFSYAIRLIVLVWTLYFLPDLFRVKLSRQASVFLICFVLFWFWYFCRLTIDFWLNPSVLRMSYSEYAAFSILVCFLPALGCFLITYQGKVKEVEKWLLISLLIGGVLVFWSLYTSGVEIDLETSQLQVSKINSTSISWMGLALSITSLYIFLKRMKSYINIPLIVVGFGFLLGLSLLGLGASRATALEFLAGIGLLLFIFRAHLGIGSTVIALLMLAVLGYALFVALNSDLLNVLSGRIETGLFQDSSRLEFFINAFERYLTAPVLGLGIEPLGWYPHNLLLEAFLANGFLFGMLTCFLILLVMSYAFRLIMFRGDLALLPLLYILSTASAMVSGNIYSSNLFWVLQAAVAGLYLNRRKELSSKN